MRIAIDATAVSLERAGAGVYIINLIRALARVDVDNVYTIFAKKDNVPALGALPAHFHIVPAASRARPLRLAWEQTVLPWQLQRQQIEILHSPHYTTPWLRIGRSVVTFHDMTFFLFPEKHTPLRRLFFRFVIPYSARQADGLIAVSETTKQDMVRLLGISPERISVIHSAPDPRFRPMTDQAALDEVRQRYAHGEPFILYVGTLEPRKNLGVLLEAYWGLRSAGLKHRLVIAGKRGWGYQEIFATVQRLRLEEWVTFTGYVPEADLPLLYNAADLFVYPSLYEGFGLPPLEAMACGVPVVASDVSSIPEVVGDGGLLVDPRDSEAWRTAMERVLADPALGEALRERGLRRAAQFTWEQTARETLAVYQQVQSGKRT